MSNPDIQITTWEAVGPMLSPICSDPELLQQLSHHWLRLRRLERLNQELFAREIGVSPQVEDKGMMIGLWQEVLEGATTLAAHAGELSAKLERAKGEPQPTLVRRSSLLFRQA